MLLDSDRNFIEIEESKESILDFSRSRDEIGSRKSMLATCSTRVKNSMSSEEPYRSITSCVIISLMRFVLFSLSLFLSASYNLLHSSLYLLWFFITIVTHMR